MGKDDNRKGTQYLKFLLNQKNSLIKKRVQYSNFIINLNSQILFNKQSHFDCLILLNHKDDIPSLHKPN